MRNIIRDVDAIVVGLGSGGSFALSKLDRLGVNAANGHAIVGIDAGPRLDPRRNVVVEWSHVRNLHAEQITGTAAHHEDPTLVGIGSFVNDVRQSLVERGVPLRFDTAVTGVERLHDGRLQLSLAGTDELYRTRYLVNGAAGKLPNSSDLGVQLTGRSAERAQDFLVSIWENPNDLSGRVPLVTRSFDGGPDRESTLMMGGGDHAQIMTYLRRGERLNEAEQRVIIAQASAAAEHARIGDAPVVLGNRVQTQIVPVRGATAHAYAAAGLLNVGDAIQKLHPLSGGGLNLGAVTGTYGAKAIAVALRDPARGAAQLEQYATTVDRLYAKVRPVSEQGFAQQA